MSLGEVPAPRAAQVIHLDPGRTTEIKRTGPFCFHRQYELDESTRTVACGSCGVTLDAFKILLDYANRERSWRYYENEINRAKEALAELKAEERKVKTRTKNANRKEATVALAEAAKRSERERLEIIRQARDIGESCRRIESVARGKARLGNRASVTDFESAVRLDDRRRK